MVMIALIVAILAPVSTRTAFAQTDAAATVVATVANGGTSDQSAPAQEDDATTDPTDAPVADVPQSTAQPSDVPAETVVATQPPAPEQPVETQPATVPATVAPTAAPQPVLTYSSPSQAACQTASGGSGIIESGGTLDYSCTSVLAISGRHIAPESVALVWSVSADVDGAWQVQLRSPESGADWTAGNSNKAALSYQGGIPDRAASATTDGFDASITLAFEVRVRRAACDAAPRTLTLQSSAHASLPGIDAATIAQTSEQTQPLVLTPGLAPIPDPTLTFDGPLDFGTVPVTSAGPQTPDPTANLAMAVEGLGASCGDWRLMARASSSGGDVGALTTSELLVVAVDGKPLAGGPCDLFDACGIDVINAGPDVANTGRYTVTVQLRLPDGAPAGTFNATITGDLEPVQ